MDPTLPSLTFSSSSSWDSLKKSARRYESQCYTKLTELSRHASSINSLTSAAISAHSSQSGSASSQSIIDVAESSGILENEISDLLIKLTSTTEEMNKIISSDPQSAVNETNSYTLQRYRAILHDYTAEFKKTKETINSARQRAELLLPSSSSPSSANDSLLGNDRLRPRTDLLLREKNSLHNSLRITDEIILQATESRDSLHQQGQMFGLIRGRVNSLRTKFPVVNNLIGRIERQRKKDVIVMASVIATCICFTVIYIANKPR